MDSTKSRMLERMTHVLVTVLVSVLLWNMQQLFYRLDRVERNQQRIMARMDIEPVAMSRPSHVVEAGEIHALKKPAESK